MSPIVRITGAAVMTAAALSMPACASRPAAQAPTATTSSAGAAAVRDGALEFRLLDVSTARQAASPDGNPLSVATAKGQFVIITLRVTNVSDRPQGFLADNQKLTDTGGHRYGADAEAVVDLDPAGAYATIPPGSSIDTRVAFDVPIGTTPAAVEAHEAEMSPGVTIRLP